MTDSFIAQGRPGEKKGLRSAVRRAPKCDHSHGLAAAHAPRLECRMHASTRLAVALPLVRPSRMRCPMPTQQNRHSRGDDAVAAAPSSRGRAHLYRLRGLEHQSGGRPRARSARPSCCAIRFAAPGAELALYDEGFLKVTALRKGNAEEPFFLDLRFVDPVPKLDRVIAVRWLTAALGCGALTALAAFLHALRRALHCSPQSALGVATLATAATLYVGLYSEPREDPSSARCTAARPCSQLIANFGSIKKFRAFVPMLSHAIEEAAERIGADTAAFLRAEMREHYRLRGDGVLDNDECAKGTGRILAQFDVQL